MRGMFATAAALVVAAPLLLAASASASGPQVATYEVAITDLTAGQPLTPPVVATHVVATGMFDVGAPASFALKEIAENGNLAPMLARQEGTGNQEFPVPRTHGVRP